MCDTDNSIDFEPDIKRDPDFVPYGSPSKNSYAELTERKQSSSSTPKDFNNKDSEGPLISKRRNLDECGRAGGVILEEPFFTQVNNTKDDSGQQNLRTISAKCLTCKDKEVVIKGQKNVSSNFIKHLKRVHPEMYEFYEKNKKFKRLTYSAPTINLNDKIIAFIADAMVPISIVENPYFINLFQGYGAQIMGRKACITRLNENFNTLMNNVKHLMFKNKYFCTTADIWTCNKMSYFGYTCHWIDENFNRCSAALACKRFSESHSFNRISSIILEINTKFGLNYQNIVATVTDNGSNYVKAFKENGISPVISLMEDIDECENIEDDEPDLLDFTSVDVSQDFVNVLPKHCRCASQTINLIASIDFINELKKNTLLYMKHSQIFSKCSKLWDKASRPISSEIITNTLGISLIYPVVTRWNSVYDAVKNILLHKEKLPELCENLMLPKFSLAQLEYLEEYCVALAPLAECLEFLQGEKATFYGYLIPSLATLKVKFDRITSSGSLKCLNNEVMALKHHLMRRFQNFFELKEEAYDAVVASVTCPPIKFRWLNVISKTSNKTLEDVKSIVLEYANQISGITHFTNQRTEDISYFDFGDEDIKPQTSSSLELNSTEWELLTYSSDTDTNFDILKRYPTLMKLFLKYNAVLSSSAPVESLFSFADIINAPNRSRLSDLNFEKLVLLKANLKFKDIN